MEQRPAFGLVDWGTTSFRLWLVTGDGAVLRESRGREGMLHAADEGFEPVLARHLRAVAAPEGLSIVICGMAGARQGWREAPYLPVPADPAALAASAIRVSSTLGDVRILPGLSQPDREAPDVMRGEETQLLGLLAAGSPSLVCMPGTHCKWVAVEVGRIARFSTYPTGELFDVLARHSILKHAVEPDARGTQADSAFRAGLRLGLADPAGLTARLFGVRAGQLLGFSERGEGAARLSGLLIGAEIGAALERFERPAFVTLLASGTLAALYADALEAAGLPVERADAEDATRAGLLAAARHIARDAGPGEFPS